MEPISHSVDGPILVTGAAGFIGSHAARGLLARGHSVVGIDNFDPYYSAELKQQNLSTISAMGLPGPDSKPRFVLERADICDRVAIQDVFERYRPQGVVHLAAKAGVRPSIADPVAYSRVNVMGTSVILAAAHRAGCDRIILASSSSVYGNCPSAPFHEGLDVNAPISPYAATKRACELLAHTHNHITGQPVACLRFFTVYGPRQRPDLAIASFLKKVSKGETIKVYGDGSSSRDYTFVSDIVEGILAAWERAPRYGYRVWNLGNSSPVTLTEMIATISRVVGREAVVERSPMQMGDVERTWADLTRSKAELGYEPKVGFEEGVRAQWEAVGQG